MRRRTWVFWLLATGLLLQASVGVATTYYASPGGPDNNCSAATNRGTPANSANKGASCLASGDTLVLLDGIYHEALDDVLPAGSSGRPTILKADNKRQAILDTLGVASTLTSNGKRSTNCTTQDDGVAKNYVTMDGLHFKIPLNKAGAATSWGGPCAAGSVHDIVFINNEIEGGCTTGNTDSFTIGFGQEGNGAFYTFSDNYIHDIGVGPNTPVTMCDNSSPLNWAVFSYGVYISGSDNLFERNEFTRTTGFAFHGYSTGDHFHRNVLRNNYFHDTGGPVLICGSENQIYNNILFRTGVGPLHSTMNDGQTHDGGGFVLAQNCSNVQANTNQMYHNTIVYANLKSGGACDHSILLGGWAGSPIPGGACAASNANNNLVENNLLWRNTAMRVSMTTYDDSISNTGEGSGTNTITPNLNCGTVGCEAPNPLFVHVLPNQDIDPSLDYNRAPAGQSGREWFQLQSSSPAVNTGAAVGITTDISGATRTGAPDMGAWEFAGTTAPPALPQELYVYWRLDETTGTSAADSAIHDPPLHPGTLTALSGSSPPLHVGGRVGAKGIGIAVSGGYVATTLESWPANQDVTLAFWVLTDGSTYGPGLGFGSVTPNLMGVCVSCGGTLYWQYGTWDDSGPGGPGSMYTDFHPYLGTWTHVVVSGAGNSSAGKIWINGQLKASQGPFSAPSSTLTNVAFEAGRWNKTGFVVTGTGTLDDVRLYTQVLSDANVLALYRALAGRIRHRTGAQ